MQSAFHQDRKRCTSCREQLPLTAFNRASRSSDGHSSTCRRCVGVSRRLSKGVLKKDAMRAAIKAGDLTAVKREFAGSRFSMDEMLSMAMQNCSSAPKHNGHEELADFFVSHGAIPRSGMALEAAREGSAAMVGRLISGGLERDIFTCATVGDESRTKQLLRRDRTLARARMTQDGRRYLDFTPLHCCCISALGRASTATEKSLVEVAAMLLENGADVNAKGRFYGYEVTPLDMAAHTGGNLPLVRLLIDSGASVSSFGFGEALSHRGRRLEEGIAMADLFLRSGFKIGTPYKDGTLLHNSANTSSHEVVRWLLEHGADVHARGRLGRTPLHLAAERNMSTVVVEILKEWGAKLNERDDLGMTALDVARLHGKQAVADWLQQQT